jgi:hypothetical protein
MRSSQPIVGGPGRDLDHTDRHDLVEICTLIVIKSSIGGAD